MAVSKNIVSNLSKDKYTIKAQSTMTISFNGANPNYYRITNGGATPLYLGVSMMPTEYFFDTKINAASTKVYVDAYGHEEIYIYNPSVSDANIIITSFSEEFNSTALALSDIGQDFSQIDFSGSVDATGDLKTEIEAIKTAVTGMKSTVSTIGVKTSDMQTFTGELYNQACSKYITVIEEQNNSTVANSIKCAYVDFLSNDGDTDITITVSNSSIGTKTFTIKPNEVLSQLHFSKNTTITIPIGSTYRIMTNGNKV